MTATRLDALLKFLEDDPEDIFTRYAVALEYASMGKPQEAIARLKDIIVRNPEYVPAYQQLGPLLHRAGDLEGTDRVLREGILVAGRLGDSHARAEMQDLLDELGNGEE